MRSRTFQRRGKEITVLELEHLVAIRDPSIPIQLAQAVLPEADALSFQEAGWRFIERARAKELRGRTTATVFIRNSRLLLSSGGVVVKFKEGTTPEQIDRVLRSNGLKVGGAFLFSPTLYAVSPRTDDPIDVIEIVSKLNSLDQCVSAEPDFIEAIGARST